MHTDPTPQQCRRRKGERTRYEYTYLYFQICQVCQFELWIQGTSQHVLLLIKILCCCLSGRCVWWIGTSCVLLAAGRNSYDSTDHVDYAVSSCARRAMCPSYYRREESDLVNPNTGGEAEHAFRPIGGWYHTATC